MYIDIQKDLLVSQNIAGLRQWISDNAPHFVYAMQKEEDYITHPLTPQIIQTLKGANTVLSNSNGDTEVTYWKHSNDAYQYIPAETIASNDNFIVVTDDGYAIGNEQDFITY